VTRILLPLLALVAGLSTATPAWASTPRDELRNRVEELFAIAEDHGLTADERAVRARSVVATMFDFSTTARRAFGTYWRRLTATQRDEATGLVAGFLTEGLVARVSQAPRRSADRMRQRLVFGTESVSGERATVSLKLGAGREDLPITADMVRRGSRWRVDDLRLDGVSLVANYRAQLDRLLRGASYATVAERLQTKRDALHFAATTPRPTVKEARGA
jgi:phospholipid transport system substrate-binding protein